VKGGKPTEVQLCFEWQKVRHVAPPRSSLLAVTPVHRTSFAPILNTMLLHKLSANSLLHLPFSYTAPPLPSPSRPLSTTSRLLSPPGRGRARVVHVRHGVHHPLCQQPHR
jgi:hypothetical protein